MRPVKLINVTVIKILPRFHKYLLHLIRLKFILLIHEVHCMSYPIQHAKRPKTRWFLNTTRVMKLNDINKCFDGDDGILNDQLGCTPPEILGRKFGLRAVIS